MEEIVAHIQHREGRHVGVHEAEVPCKRVAVQLHGLKREAVPDGESHCPRERVAIEPGRGIAV